MGRGYDKNCLSPGLNILVSTPRDHNDKFLKFLSCNIFLWCGVPTIVRVALSWKRLKKEYETDRGIGKRSLMYSGN